MKLHQIVKEWLSEFKSINDDYAEFNSKYFGNKKFYNKLASAIENKSDIEPICHQIYNFAHLKNPVLDIMVLDFLPVIIETYLILSFTPHKNIRDSDNSLLLIRTCFLSVYNLLKSKVVEDPDKDSKPSFFIPTFTDGSIFHSQVGRPDLDFLNYSVTVSQPKTTIVNDKQLIPGLIQIYNQFISKYSEVSLNDFCSLSSRIASLNIQPRIDVSSETLNELLVGIYFIIFKKPHAAYATQTLKLIETRANYEIMPSVILTANAIQNSFQSNCHEEPFDGPIGLKTMLKSRSETISNENVITNANFRPEKVAEDLEHLLDINQNSVNKPSKTEGGHHGNKADHNADLSDVNIQFKLTINTNPKSSGKSKTSVKYEKSLLQNGGENRMLHETEAQL